MGFSTQYTSVCWSISTLFNSSITRGVCYCENTSSLWKNYFRFRVLRFLKARHNVGNGRFRTILTFLFLPLLPVNLLLRVLYFRNCVNDLNFFNYSYHVFSQNCTRIYKNCKLVEIIIICFANVSNIYVWW